MRSRMDGSVNSEIQVFDTAYRWRQCVAAEKFPLCVLMLFCRILLSNDEFFIIVARHSYTSCTFLSFTPLQQFLLCHCVSLSVPVSISPFFCHTIHCSFQHRMFNVSSICFRTFFLRTSNILKTVWRIEPLRRCLDSVFARQCSRGQIDF